MARDAGRTAALSQVFQEIYEREPAITSAEVLLEFARRTQRGRHLRVNRADAKNFLEPSGRTQVYKRVPVEWAGRSASPQRQMFALISISGMGVRKLRKRRP